MTTPGETAALPKPFAIRVLCLGGAGISLIERLMSAPAEGVSFAAVDTNARALDAASCAEKVLLGERLLRGLGAGGDPDLGRAAAEEEAGKLKALCADADLILIVAGLGGGTATGVAPVLARVAKETGALVLGSIAVPFDFEGQRRQRQAQAGLQRLRAMADGVLCLHNQKASRLLDESTRATEIFHSANNLWSQGVFGILHMLTRRGLIDVDFADLASVLRGRHSQSCFATAEASGEARGREVVERILAHPFLDRGQALAEADALLVTLTGGPDLTIAEVNWVMDQLRRQPENANFVMGACIDGAFADKLAVTIIATKHGQSDEAASPGTSLDTRRDDASEQIETQFFSPPQTPKPQARFVPPPPDLSPEQKAQLLAQQNGKGTRARKTASKMKQGQLPLEIVSKGRFEKSEPTIHQGEDLDVPTYIRKGIKLN